MHTLLFSSKDEELRIKPILEEIIEKENQRKLVFKVSEDKVNCFLKCIIRDYLFPNYFEYSYLTNGDDRLIGDIMEEIRIKIRKEKRLQGLEKIKTGFEKYNFHKIRHQTVAHKNKSLQYPAGAPDLPIHKELITRLSEIVKDLRIQSYFWFNYELPNPHNKILCDLDLLLGTKKNYL